jgi:hypothetical protein
LYSDEGDEKGQNSAYIESRIVRVYWLTGYADWVELARTTPKILTQTTAKIKKLLTTSEESSLWGGKSVHIFN